MNPLRGEAVLCSPAPRWAGRLLERVIVLFFAIAGVALAVVAVAITAATAGAIEERLQVFLCFLLALSVVLLVIRRNQGKQVTELADVLFLFLRYIHQYFLGKLVVRRLRKLLVELDRFELGSYHKANRAHQLAVCQLALGSKPAETM